MGNWIGLVWFYCILGCHQEPTYPIWMDVEILDLIKSNYSWISDHDGSVLIGLIGCNWTFLLVSSFSKFSIFLFIFYFYFYSYMIAYSYHSTCSMFSVHVFLRFSHFSRVGGFSRNNHSTLFGRVRSAYILPLQTPPKGGIHLACFGTQPHWRISLVLL